MEQHSIKGALAILLEIKSELTELAQTLDLERAFSVGDEGEGPLFAAGAHLQTVQGQVEELGSILTYIAEGE